MKIEILISLFICHFLGDFIFLATNKWMLDAKKFGKPLYPIFCHASVHAWLMFAALFLCGIQSNDLIFKLTMIQLVTHFFIDVLKGKINVWFPSIQSFDNKWYWWIFGADQLLHALVIISMYYLALNPNTLTLN